MSLLTYGVSIPSTLPKNAGTLLYQCFRESRCIFFNLQISKMMRICYCVFDNEIPQEEKYIFVRRYLYDCTRLSQSNSW